VPAVERLASIDYVKAAAITAVVWTHAGPAPWHAGYAPLDWQLRFGWTAFQVPAFLVVAGFLYHQPRAVPLSALGPRLRRIAFPYLIACAVAQLGGFTTARSWRAATLQVLTFSSIGIYYFIGVLALCIALVWPVSRIDRGRLCVLPPALFVVASACEAYGRHLYLLPLVGGFTGVNLVQLCSLVLYPIVYFLCGWLAAQFRAQLRPIFEKGKLVVLFVGVAGIAVWIAAKLGDEAPLRFEGAARVVYTLCVIGVLIVATRRAPVPSAIRFLSDASLGIYLYHIMFQFTLQPYLVKWAPAIRIPFAVAFDLAGGVGVCLLARRLLGARARALFGA
jgi:fucose 4-O-acetylase-like acetyltransferase